MGRVKLEIRKIENPTNRQVTYSKRRNGLIKKAYELSVLCDIDIALIMFSPSGRLNHFSGKKRIEDVIARFANLSDHERAKSQCLKWSDSNNLPLKIVNPEILIRAAKKLKQETYMAIQLSSSRSVTNLETLQYEIQRTQVQLQDMENRLRVYEGDLKCVNSVQQLDNLEQHLQSALETVRIRKQAMENSHVVPFDTARAQLYGMMQAQAAAGGMLQHATPIVHWLTALRDSQANSQAAANLSDLPGPILSLRDAHGGEGECSASASSYSASLYPRALCQAVADMQAGTASQSGHESAAAQTLSHFRVRQLYQMDPRESIEDTRKVDIDSRDHAGYITTKSEEQGTGHMHGQDMQDVNVGSNLVSSSADQWHSAFQAVNPIASMPPPSGVLNPLPLNQAGGIVGMMMTGRHHHNDHQQGMIPFELGNAEEMHVVDQPSVSRAMLNDVVEDPPSLQSHVAETHNVLSLASSFNGSS